MKRLNPIWLSLSKWKQEYVSKHRLHARSWPIRKTQGLDGKVCSTSAILERVWNLVGTDERIFFYLHLPKKLVKLSIARYLLYFEAASQHDEDQKNDHWKEEWITFLHQIHLMIKKL